MIIDLCVKTGIRIWTRRDGDPPDGCLGKELRANTTPERGRCIFKTIYSPGFGCGYEGALSGSSKQIHGKHLFHTNKLQLGVYACCRLNVHMGSFACPRLERIVHPRGSGTCRVSTKKGRSPSPPSEPQKIRFLKATLGIWPQRKTDK